MIDIEYVARKSCLFSNYAFNPEFAPHPKRHRGKERAEAPRPRFDEAQKKPLEMQERFFVVGDR